jgi:hypothetical protein
VQQQFDIHANPVTGIITGTVYGNNQLTCGNVLSTQWLVTEYKATNQAGGLPQYYCLTSPGTFNPALTQPCQLPPPPPGFIPLFSNPINKQKWVQPLNTEGDFFGNFNFTGATLLGSVNWPYYNNAPTGTTCNELVKLDASGNAIVTAGGEGVSAVVGVAAYGCGSAGIVSVAIEGQTQVVFDSANPVVGDAVGVSSTSGRATDLGIPSATTQSIGRLIATPLDALPGNCNVAPGCWVQLGIGGSGGGGGGGGTGTVTSVGAQGTPNQIVVTGSTPITNAGSFTFSLDPNLILPPASTATTQAPGDPSAKVATDAFVLANAGAGVPPGIVYSTTAQNWSQAGITTPCTAGVSCTITLPSGAVSPARSPFNIGAIAGWIIGTSSGAAFNELAGAGGLSGGFETGGSGSTPLSYYIVVHDTTANTYSSPMQILNCLSTGSDAITVRWPRIANGTDTILYDVIRMTTPVGPTNIALTYPY